MRVHACPMQVWAGVRDHVIEREPAFRAFRAACRSRGATGGLEARTLDPTMLLERIDPIETSLIIRSTANPP